MDSRRLTLVTAIAALVMTLGAPTLGASQSQDETDIRRLETRQQDAWNHHDAKAYASLFSADGRSSRNHLNEKPAVLWLRGLEYGGG